HRRSGWRNTGQAGRHRLACDRDTRRHDADRATATARRPCQRATRHRRECAALVERGARHGRVTMTILLATDFAGDELTQWLTALRSALPGGTLITARASCAAARVDIRTAANPPAAPPPAPPKC